MRCLLIALLLAGTAAAADPTRDLAALEQRMTGALARSDAAAIEALWADDLVWVGLNGKLATKAEQLEGMKAQAPA
ncbi:MAG TPA: nuclear transport factor 2 family protein, partial [Gammaproteobacteria bacterium]|nr:nuclear transport factor 2 family protein [Gammaproteobacteria bacterium]